MWRQGSHCCPLLFELLEPLLLYVAAAKPGPRDASTPQRRTSRPPAPHPHRASRRHASHRVPSTPPSPASPSHRVRRGVPAACHDATPHGSTQPARATPRTSARTPPKKAYVLPSALFLRGLVRRRCVREGAPSRWDISTRGGKVCDRSRVAENACCCCCGRLSMQALTYPTNRRSHSVISTSPLI